MQYNNISEHKYLKSPNTMNLTTNKTLSFFNNSFDLKLKNKRKHRPIRLAGAFLIIFTFFFSLSTQFGINKTLPAHAASVGGKWSLTAIIHGMMKIGETRTN